MKDLRFKSFTKFKFAAAFGCLAAFLLLIVLIKTVDVAQIGPCGTKIGLSGLNASVRDALGSSEWMYKLTEWIGYCSIALAAALALMGLIQLVGRRSLKKVDREILALGGLFLVLAAIYLFFEIVVVNYRPVLEEGQSFPEASFPSSHTMLTAVIVGGAAIVARSYVPNRTFSLLLSAAGVSVILFTAAARLLSGVHWFTDILAGAILSASLLLAFSGCLDVLCAHPDKKAGGAGSRGTKER